ncbi:hypothetical protein [Actibacterium sp. XHP0104]|uniref:hypothetical protein n=1 Tax=Actibacterium sp. XHP0104 TaxID=2984335 RepID=UPI0021E9A8FB|nr:hypothetical protein [Actibacterium sp. XHP0104]MCV2881629.1 hypothetical protein [Actibacterium sp. XHP0104]
MIGEAPNRPDMARLMAALPHIAAAPKSDAPISVLCTRETFGARHHPDRLWLDRDTGVAGDRWHDHPWLRLDDGRPDPRIQVSVLSQRVHDLVVGSGMHPGDTIIADLDTSAANLPNGTLIGAGEAVLRVSDVFNDGCVKWKVRYGEDAKDWLVLPDHVPLRLRGLLCEIVKSGWVSTGDQLVRL